MRTSTITKLLGLLLLGCSTEHTIADETGTDQPMMTIARPVCVEMCNHALGCGDATESDVVRCMTQCERDCVILEGEQYVVAIRETGRFITAPELIAETSACYLASECGQNAHTCDVAYLTSVAAAYSTPLDPAKAGNVGMSSCGLQENQLTCDTSLAQGTDPENFTWELTCERANVTATEWTCKCYEYGVEVAQKTGVPSEGNDAMLEFCWSKERLSCFYRNKAGC